VQVNVEVVQRPVIFPSVTVCNKNHLDTLVVDRLHGMFDGATSSKAWLHDDSGQVVHTHVVRRRQSSLLYGVVKRRSFTFTSSKAGGGSDADVQKFIRRYSAFSDKLTAFLKHSENLSVMQYSYEIPEVRAVQNISAVRKFQLSRPTSIAF